MTAARRRSGPWRQLFLTLAVLALALKVLVPAGFMVQAPSPAAAFPLVLCTEHGTVALDAAALPGAHATKKAPAQKPAHDSPCVFAGHGAASVAPGLFSVAAVAFADYRVPPIVLRRELAPGRGLAAPPLPARGPPSQLT